MLVLAAICILIAVVYGAVTDIGIDFGVSNYTTCESTLPYVTLTRGKCSYTCSRINTIGFSSGQNFVCSKDGKQPVTCIHGKCEIGDCEIVMCEKDDFDDCIHKRQYTRTRLCVVYRGYRNGSKNNSLVKGAKLGLDGGFSYTRFSVIDGVFFGVALTAVLILRYTVKRIYRRHVIPQANNIPSSQGQSMESNNHSRNSYSPVNTNSVTTSSETTPPPKYSEISQLQKDETPPPSYKEAIELQMILSSTNK